MPDVVWFLVAALELLFVLLVIVVLACRPRTRLRSPDAPAGAQKAEASPPSAVAYRRTSARGLGARRLGRAFGAAFGGLGQLIRDEPNARIHVALAGVATGLGLWLGLPPAEWAVLLALFGLVLGLEAMNTAIEAVADLARPEPDARVRRLKDVAAGGVLVGALAAAGAGACLFVPRLVRLLG